MPREQQGSFGTSQLAQILEKFPEGKPIQQCTSFWSRRCCLTVAAVPRHHLSATADKQGFQLCSVRKRVTVNARLLLVISLTYHPHISACPDIVWSRAEAEAGGRLRGA